GEHRLPGYGAEPDVHGEGMQPPLYIRLGIAECFVAGAIGVREIAIEICLPQGERNQIREVSKSLLALGQGRFGFSALRYVTNVEKQRRFPVV
ncbi:MAG: hypothetical protein QGG69_05420, partial [Kiritimatiellia bacterium]|nr:hypothetical protein [Kiritimatiellia bacterium]